MILGVGSDLIDVRRIERTIDRHSERFLARIFTATERAKADGRARRAETYAKRFAAKEACAKALGTGIMRGVWWRDMGVVNLHGGRPTMSEIAERLGKLTAGTEAGGPPGSEGQAASRRAGRVNGCQRSKSSPVSARHSRTEPPSRPSGPG